MVDYGKWSVEWFDGQSGQLRAEFDTLEEAESYAEWVDKQESCVLDSISKRRLR